MPAERNILQEAADQRALQQAVRYATVHKQPLTLTEEQVALLDRVFTEIHFRCECGRCHLTDA